MTTCIDAFWPVSTRHLSGPFLRSLDDRTFAELCRRVRQRVLRCSGSRRHAKNIVSMLHRKRYPYNYAHRPRLMIRARHKDSVILDALLPGRKAIWLDPRRRKIGKPIALEQFSFLDDAAGTVRSLVGLADAEARVLETKVDFADQHMLDVSPYLVWGLMHRDMAPFMKGGSISPAVHAAVEATGLNRFMRIGLRGQGADVRIQPFKVRSSGTPAAQRASDIGFQPSRVEKVGDELVAAVDGWLRAAGFELSPYGKERLFDLSGELLDNAQRHARIGGDGNWSVAGLMERRPLNPGRPGDAHLFVCNFAFVSLGLTIAQTIRSAQDATVREDLATYCRSHAFAARMEEDVLATVFALQDGVSRVSQISGTKGGVGLMTAVEAVSSLGDGISAAGGATLAVISGSSCVRLAPPYLAPDLNGALRYQWLNEQRTPRLPPSDSHAFTLPASFPGTIITARFVLADRTMATTQPTPTP